MLRVSTLRLWCTAVLALVFAAATLSAQTAAREPRETALRFLRDNPARFGLSAADVADLRVTDEYLSKNNGVTHVWLQQQHLGVPVHNALIGLHVKPDGNVAHLGHRFVVGLDGKTNTALPSLSAPKALQMALLNLGFEGFEVPRVKEKINERNWIFSSGAVAKTDIPVSICYQPRPDGSVRLAWSLVIDQANSADVWSLRVDAQTGEILEKNNRTIYCKVDHEHTGGNAADCHETVETAQATPKTSAPAAANAEVYNVFALPVESPSHGNRTMLTNPANATASPYGWQDSNGAAGAEYTYTRGNNVWAYDDSANDSAGDPSESAQGGAGLNFDFPFDADAEPDGNRDAAITNLFYLNNMMHDITYLYGFDEKSGNFQKNNYGNGGAGNDEVQAEALDGGGTDNANFSTPGDGGSGRMQMYKWSRQGGKIVKVNAPGAILGTYGATASGTWGAPITQTPVTADAVVVSDGTAEATLGCNEIINDVNGKIALVDRGVCEFGLKALNAEQAGAVGCIICNFEDATAGMAAGAVGAQVTIPVVMMQKKDCDLLRQFSGAGLNVSLVLPVESGPDFLDGDFDNGIIAHEYGHGISNRLTGGSATADCLFNAEQMGEGWSDFFSLILTAKPGDLAEQRRGVGTFVFRQDNDGGGIRRYPYTTDMNINPLTFGSVAQNTEVHALGEIWTAVTWDLYWAMVEKYGFDADITNVNSGNGRAIQLVMDGLKLQPCGPGFIDGRDAILLADLLDYNGADTCLITTVFARRGFGIGASQGSSDNAADGVENFDPVPTCIKELKIKKTTSTPLIDAGATVNFNITVTNHKDEAATDVTVTDELPAGLTFVSASNGGTFSGGLVTWNLGSMPTGQIVNLTYSAVSDPALGSLRFFRDEMENDNEWIPLWSEGTSGFALQTDSVKVGAAAWRADDEPTETDMTLEYINSVVVSGDQPIMRFWHQYNTEGGADAGFIEIRRVSEQQWIRLPKDKSFRNPYPGAVQYGTFAIPFLNGFSGNSGGWTQSYFDLSDFAGQEITFRFRFGTDDNTDVTDGNWIIDEVEMMDMINYDGQACVQSGQGDLICAKAPERGVIVNTVGNVGAEEVEQQLGLNMLVQPNPATDLLHISLDQPLDGNVRVALIAADGREVLNRIAAQGLAAGQVLTLDVQQVPAGVYVVRLQSQAGSGLRKVVIR